MLMSKKIKSLLFSIASAFLLIGTAMVVPVSLNNPDLMITESNSNATFNKAQITENITDLEFDDSNSNTKLVIAKDDANGDRLYGWGSNNFGQLGVGSLEDRFVPTLIEIPGLPAKYTITMAAISSEYSALVINGTDLYFAGSNAVGQFGNGTTNRSPFLTFVKSSQFCIGGQYEGTINQVAIAGQTTAVLLTDNSNNKRLFTFGSNENNLLGHGKEEVFSTTPIDITSKFAANLSGSIASGDKTFAIITNDGLYMWGDNTEGAFGLGNNTLYPTPIKITTLSKNVSKIWITSENKYVLDDNKLYVAGINRYGSLGLNHTQPVNLFTELKNQPWGTDKILDICYTISTVTVLTANGVYVAGENDPIIGGSLGLGDSVTIKHTFTEIVDLRDHVSASSKILGFDHTNILINDSTCWAWGHRSWFGNGPSSAVEHSPVSIETFGVPSSLLSKTNNDSVTADAALADFYSNASFDSTNFKKYVDLNNFPTNAQLSLKQDTTPRLDTNGRIHISVTADRAFTDDRINVTGANFDVVIANFKMHTRFGSKLDAPKDVVAEGWLSSIKDAEENIVQAKLAKYLTLYDMPVNPVFKISSLNIEKTTLGFDISVTPYYDSNSVLQQDWTPMATYSLELLPRTTQIKPKDTYPTNILVDKFFDSIFQNNVLIKKQLVSYADFLYEVEDATYTLVKGSYTANAKDGIVQFALNASEYYDSNGAASTDRSKTFNLRFQFLPNNDANDNMPPWWLWLIVGVLAIAVVALIVVIIMLKRQHDLNMVRMYRKIKK